MVFHQGNQCQGLVLHLRLSNAVGSGRQEIKTLSRKYVGRLAADSVVNITAKFRTEFPQYAQGTFYFGLDKTLDR